MSRKRFSVELTFGSAAPLNCFHWCRYLSSWYLRLAAHARKAAESQPQEGFFIHEFTGFEKKDQLRNTAISDSSYIISKA